jgi:hypothetical protein
MEKEYLNCKYGLTPECPQFNNPTMQKLLAKPKNANPFKYFKHNEIDITILLCCKECAFFLPRFKSILRN